MDWRKRSGSGNWRLRAATGICEMPLDQDAQAEALIQLTREQEPRIGGYRCSPDLKAECTGP